jgi:PIN domain
MSALEAPLHAYLDTNTLVEFNPPDQNDWLDLLGVNPVVLVVAHVVVEELQWIKDGGNYPRRKKQRAGEMLKKLEKLLFPNPGPTPTPANIRPGVELRYDGGATPRVVFERYRLSETMNDDRLVAAILAARDGGANVCLVGNDAGPRWKCKAQGVPAFDMRDAWRVAEEPDPLEVENRELKKRVAAHESRAPRLTLAFSSGDRMLRSIPKPRLPLADYVAHHLDRQRALHPGYDNGRKTIHDEAMERQYGTPSRDRFHHYRMALPMFFEVVEERLAEIIDHRNARDRLVPVHLVVENTGSAVAEGVRVVVSGPSHFGVQFSPFKRPPALPQPPPSPYSAKPNSVDDYLPRVTVLPPPFMWPLLMPEEKRPPERAGPDWECDATTMRIAVNIGDVRHAAGPVAVPRFFFLLGSFDDAKPFHFEYELHAHNLAEPERKCAHVILTKGEKLSWLPFSRELPSFMRDQDESHEPPDDEPEEDVA